VTGVTHREWAAVFVVLAFAVPARGRAMPLYASREGRTCVTCHFDPNGGGIRNDFGFFYGKNRHSMGIEEKWSKVTVDPQLNEWIRLGVDMRFMYYGSNQEGEDLISGASTFFPMQGQVNLAVTPFDQLTVVATHGMVAQVYFGNPYVAREIYALLPKLPLNGYAQIGRFRLPFGLRQDDHTSFLRTTGFLYFDSQVPDAGIEIGAIGRNLFAQFSLTNGSHPFTEQARVYTGKVGYAGRGVQGAVSGLHRASDTGGDDRIERWSGYLSATRGRFSVLGEYGGGTTKSPYGVQNLEAAFGEVDYLVSRGLNLRAKIDYIGWRSVTPATPVRRYTADIDLNPMPFTLVKISYRWYNYSNSPDWSQYFAMLFVPF
jgi:hypothetical protein